MIPLRAPTIAPQNVAPFTSTQQKPNKNKKESNREAALNFLATKISFSDNSEPNPISPPRRLPQPRPASCEFKFTYEDEYETFAEEAEEFDDHRPPSPFEPDGPDADR